MNKQNSILYGNLDKVLWVIAFPIVITSVIEGLYGIIDSLFVANVGTIAVASVAFVGPIQDTMNAIGMGLSIAGCSLIARYIGAQDENRARRMIGNLALIGLCIGFLVSLFTFTFAATLLENAGATTNIMNQARTYLRLISWGILFNFINLIYLAIARAQGNTKIAIFINTCSIALKVFFCYLFTVWQDFGIIGIGMATILAQSTCSVACLCCLFSARNPRLLHAEEYSIKLPLAKILFITALPLIFEKSLMSYGYIMINKYVLAFGEPVLAAYGLANSVNSVSFKATTALGTGLSVIIAQNIGAGNALRAKQAVQKAFTYSILLSLAFLVFLIPFRAQISALFVDVNDVTYQHMVNAMTIYTVSVIPWGLTECVLGMFQGIGKTKYNLMISLVRIYVLRLPVVIIFCQPIWGLAEFGVWYAMLVSNSLCAIFSLGLYFIKRKKELSV